MTRYELARRTVVQQAFLDGKPCQHDDPCSSVWFDMKPNVNYEWDWDHHVYRLKPEPRVIYVADRLDGEGIVGNRAWESQEQCRVDGAKRIVKFAEVLEDGA